MGESDLQTVVQELLGFSKMNWNTFDLYTKLPATVHSSNEIARIGFLLQQFGRNHTTFAFSFGDREVALKEFMAGLNFLDEHSQVERFYHCPPYLHSPANRPPGTSKMALGLELCMWARDKLYQGAVISHADDKLAMQLATSGSGRIEGNPHQLHFRP